MTSAQRPDSGRTQRLATWAATLEYSDLDAGSVSQLKASVLDAFGCALYGFGLPSTQVVLRAMAGARVSAGGARVWGTPSFYEPMVAAMVNGAAIQAFELDDVHGEAMLHGSSTMLPAVLAIADLRPGLSGRDMLTALGAGWEVGVRINRCMGPHVLARGWHAPTVFGTIAAAAAAARALHLEPERYTHALMLGVLQAGGLLAVQYEGMAKRLYAGCAAKAGVLSTLLAEQGFTAPADALEHPVGGFIATFARGDPVFPDTLDRELGQDLAAATIAFKLHANCAAMHPAIDAFAELCAREPRLRPDTIERIVVELTEHGYKHVGWPYVPNNATTAQFSDALLADRVLLALVDRIEVVHAPHLDTEVLAARHRCCLSVCLKDGTVLHHARETARGRPDDPVAFSVVENKFFSLTEEIMTRPRSHALADRIAVLEGLADVSVLSSELQAGPAPAEDVSSRGSRRVIEGTNPNRAGPGPVANLNLRKR